VRVQGDSRGHQWCRRCFGN